MKKLTALLLAVAMCVALSGCAQFSSESYYEETIIDSGVFITIERDGIWRIGWVCEDFSGAIEMPDGTPIPKGETAPLIEDMVAWSENAGTPISFTVTARGKDDEVLSTKRFTFHPGTHSMFLVLDENGIEEVE